MEQPLSPILDYASPRPRVKLRLPADSVLRCTRHELGSCEVVESLTGQIGAAAALAFAGFVLAVVLLTGVANGPTQPGIWLVTAVEATLLITVGLLVVRNTWRQTVLRVFDGEITVTFTAP